jgi:hypothetical protein
VSRVRVAYARAPDRSHEPPARRSAPDGRDARRDRSQGRSIVALGIDTGGVKPPLGLWDGSTENAAVATTLLSNLVERLDGEQSVLVVLDGARAAWAIDDHHPGARSAARARLRARSQPLGPAASLREGLEETLTVIRLGVHGRLKRTLAWTSPCEPMIDTVRRVSRDVKRWQNGDMCLRWTAACMLEAEASLRKIHRPPRPHQARPRRRSQTPPPPPRPLTCPSRPRRRRSPPHPLEIITHTIARREVPRRPGHPPSQSSQRTRCNRRVVSTGVPHRSRRGGVAGRRERQRELFACPMRRPSC